jgi:hypothetical protein
MTLYGGKEAKDKNGESKKHKGVKSQKEDNKKPRCEKMPKETQVDTDKCLIGSNSIHFARHYRRTSIKDTDIKQ